MRRECKCHGLSGSCTIRTCWMRLPSFREIGKLLHDSYDKSMRVTFTPTQLAPASATSQSQRHTSLVRSNRKRSHKTPTRHEPSQQLATLALLEFNALATNGNNEHDMLVNSNLVPSNSFVTSAAIAPDGQFNYRMVSANIGAPNIGLGHTNRARAIGNNRMPLTLERSTPSKTELVYFEDSPDYCVANDRFDLKGTRGRVCNATSSGPDSCESLCCSRGYKTEIREQTYQCDCVFKYCCKLECKWCSRKTTIHSCL
ncbi:Protein Wnt-1 [Fragariocoptes setiger]|uniref:Protein Wnt n=1 Tax=Fragariocoptes setiger TaxID=1670756 RepID=A0ABQ7S5Y3_9ACAR|nr:Protein Wnt-1 [Fragariocoptes setiger]